MMNQPRNLYGFKNPSLWTEEECNSATTHLSHWLNHDTWNFENALLLMMGVIPNSVDFLEVESDRLRTHLVQGWVTIYGERFKIENARDRLPKLIEISQDRLPLTDDSYKNQDAFALGLAAEFRKLKSIWTSGAHPELNPISYYVKWAGLKRIDIPWLEWAHGREIRMPSLQPEDQAYETDSAAIRAPMLDMQSRRLLKSLLDVTICFSDGVDEKKFRADNYRQREIIDTLLKPQFITARDGKYYLTLIALPEIGIDNPDVADLLSNCDHLFQYLRNAYLARPGREVKIITISDATRLSIRQIEECFHFLSGASILGGSSTDLNSDNAYVIPVERLLNFERFDELIEEQYQWASRAITSLGATANPFLPSLLTSQIRSQNFLSLLHPIIIEHALPKYEDGHLRNAVLDSVIAVFDLIRKRTGLPEDGDELIGKAFSLNRPYLILSEITSESGKNDQKGFMQIFKGFYQGVRNPNAHTLAGEIGETEAAQYLIFASLLARRIEEAELLDDDVSPI